MFGSQNTIKTGDLIIKYIQNYIHTYSNSGLKMLFFSSSNPYRIVVLEQGQGSREREACLIWEHNTACIICNASECMHAAGTYIDHDKVQFVLSIDLEEREILYFVRRIQGVGHRGLSLHEGLVSISTDTHARDKSSACDRKKK